MGVLSFKFNSNTCEVTFKLMCQECNHPTTLNLKLLDLTEERLNQMAYWHNIELSCSYCLSVFIIKQRINQNKKEVIVHNVDSNNSDVIFINTYDYEDEILFQEENKINAKKNFILNMEDVQNLIDLGDNLIYYKTLYKFAYIGCFGAIEGFLQEKLIELVKNEEIVLKAVAKFPDLDAKKKSLSEIVSLNIPKHIISQINKIVFHDFTKVERMYQYAINRKVYLREKLGEFTDKRHNIVHRLNKDRAGNELEVTKTEVLALVDAVKRTFEEVEQQVTSFIKSLEENKDVDKKLSMWSV